MVIEALVAALGLPLALFVSSEGVRQLIRRIPKRPRKARAKLKDGTEIEVRVSASADEATLLSEIEESLVPVYAQKLRAETPRERIAALGRLKALGGSAAAKELLAALESEHSDIRELAAAAFGQIGSEDAVPALAEVLKDPVSSVSEAAIRSLGAIGSERAADVLLLALRNDDPALRIAAAQALGNLAAGPGAKKHEPATRAKLRQAATRTLVDELRAARSAPVISAVAFALGFMGVHEAAPIIVELSQTVLEPSALEALLWALPACVGGLGGDELALSAERTLRRHLANPADGVRAKAVRGLASLGIARDLGIGAWRASLSDESSRVRVEAVRGLAKLQPSDTVLEEVVKAMHDSDSHVRDTAADVLLVLDPSLSRYQYALQRVLEDPAERERYLAERALGGPSDWKRASDVAATLDGQSEKQET